MHVRFCILFKHLSYTKKIVLNTEEKSIEQLCCLLRQFQNFKKINMKRKQLNFITAMKSNLLKFAFLVLFAICICSCSKNNIDCNSNEDAAFLNNDDTWVYFEGSTFYPNNDRCPNKKWIATNVFTVQDTVSAYNNSRNLNLTFVNKGDTRFLSNSLNPGGGEVMSIVISNFSNPPVAGVYTSSYPWYQVQCYYYAFTSSGALYDSVRSSSNSNSIASTFSITKMDSVGISVIPGYDRYKMSGVAELFILTAGTDYHYLSCRFHKVLVDVKK